MRKIIIDCLLLMVFATSVLAFSVDVHGTEYQVGDEAKVFLQLLDNEGNPLHDAECFITIFYPNGSIFVSDKMMDNTYNNGIFEYNVVIPNITGIYPVVAYCNVVYEAKWYYTPPFYEAPFRSDEQINLTEIYGDWVGDAYALNSYDDSSYLTCGSDPTTKTCEAIYEWRLENTTYESIEVRWTGEANDDITISFYVFNWSSGGWAHYGNISVVGTGYNYPVGVEESYVIYPDVSGAVNSSNFLFRLKIIASAGSSFNFFTNWLAVRAEQEGGFVQQVAGSSEFHVSSEIKSIWDYVQLIWDWLTNTLWPKILGIEQTVNLTYNNTETIISKLNRWENGTADINATVKNVLEVTNQTSAELLGTEYVQGDDGRSFVQVLKGSSVINNADCKLTVYYPNSTKFLDQVNMTSLGENGLYYYDFTVPDILGVYMAVVYCNGGDLPRPVYSVNEWHVSTEPGVSTEDQIYMIS